MPYEVVSEKSKSSPVAIFIANARIIFTGLCMAFYI